MVINHNEYELGIHTDKFDEGLTPVFHHWKLSLVSVDLFPGKISEPGQEIITFDPD